MIDFYLTDHVTTAIPFEHPPEIFGVLNGNHRKSIGARRSLGLRGDLSGVGYENASCDAKQQAQRYELFPPLYQRPDVFSHKN
jgi:hypothetical protein